MSPDPELAQRICDLLNELLELDRPAMSCLTFNRVPCNEQLDGHLAVQTGAQSGGFHVGMLGILNGLCGTRKSGIGFINAIVDLADDNPYEVKNLVRFEVHKDA